MATFPRVLKKNQSWIVFLSTFPPRECGIATFTDDLVTAFTKLFSPAVGAKVVAMNTDPLTELNYSRRVLFQIEQSNSQEYVEIAQRLNALPQVKLVNVQHEFGIFGGESGLKLLLFLKEIKKPVVLTFHTILPAPNLQLKNLVEQLVAYSQTVVVMTTLSQAILVQDYGIHPEQIQVIPHGIHPLPLTESTDAKSALHLENRTVLVTFGLLNKGKGIEYAIEALPEVIKKFPDVVYFIVGVTHPLVLQEEGEQYREFLKKKIYSLGLQDNVKFYNKYLSIKELLDFLQATDIYLSTSLEPNQAVSGTLTYALGTGRPVISTAFAQAKETITNDVGRLVEFRKPEQFSRELITLLGNEELRHQLGRNAYAKTRAITWSNVALSYMKVFSNTAPELQIQSKHLPKVKFSHLSKMTDSFGILQFSKFSEPQTASGYTTDDNARALLLTSMYYQKYQSQSVLRLLSTYLNFLKFVMREDGYFDNYVQYDKTLNAAANKNESMDDPTARALHALAVVATTQELPEQLRQQAVQLFKKSVQGNGLAFTHLRAMAFYIKALSAWLFRFPDAALKQELVRYTRVLEAAYGAQSHEAWQWFEPHLTYSNALLSEAMLNAYVATGANYPNWLDIARTSLDFLIRNTFENNIYIPIGQQEWFKSQGNRSLFDQQPEDPATMVQALKAMYVVSKDEQYAKRMRQAFYWFLGNNLLHQVVYYEATGGCYDGLNSTGINLNQGAESTIMYLLARLAVEGTG